MKSDCDTKFLLLGDKVIAYIPNSRTHHLLFLFVFIYLCFSFHVMFLIIIITKATGLSQFYLFDQC